MMRTRVSGFHLQTHIQSGAPSRHHTLGKVDKLIGEMQELRGQLGQMEPQRSQTQQSQQSHRTSKYWPF